MRARPLQERAGPPELRRADQRRVRLQAHGTSAGSNQPARPQGAQRPTAMSSSADGFSGFGVGPTIEGHADQIRSSMSEALGGSDAEAEGQSGSRIGCVFSQHRVSRHQQCRNKTQRRRTIIVAGPERSDGASLQPWHLGNVSRRATCSESSGKHGTDDGEPGLRIGGEG